jgi:hypothetical protein
VRYALTPFKYQVKCLHQLREKFVALDAEARGGTQARAGALHLIAGQSGVTLGLRRC